MRKLLLILLCLPMLFSCGDSIPKEITLEMCVEEIKNCIGYGGGEHAIDLCCSSPINQYCVNGLTYEVNRENGKKWVSDMRAWVKQDPKNKEKLFLLSKKLKFESRKTGNETLYYLAMELIEEVIIYGI